MDKISSLHSTAQENFKRELGAYGWSQFLSYQHSEGYTIKCEEVGNGEEWVLRNPGGVRIFGDINLVCVVFYLEGYRAATRAADIRFMTSKFKECPGTTQNSP